MLQLGNVSLRKELPEDKSFLVELYLSTRETEAGFNLIPPDERNRLLSQQFEFQHIDYRSKYPNGWFTIITVNEKPCGRLYVATKATEIRLVELSILPDYQNCGIGSKLVKSIQAEATRQNLPLRLSVLKGSEATRFYERLGFQKIGESPFHNAMEWRNASIQSPE